MDLLLKFYLGIRDHIISKSMCVCGATNILADDLLPNKTLRDTINRILESNNSSAENAGSALHVPGWYICQLAPFTLQYCPFFYCSNHSFCGYKFLLV